MQKAKVAVVFPVYNGAKTLESSLECIARQDFGAFRAIIVENCSTDGSLEIAERFCAKDDRFSIIRNETHLSALDNFEKSMRIGTETGEYFCLRAHDDFSSPDFLSSLVAALDNDPGKLLAGCPTKVIKAGNPDKLKKPDSQIFGFPEKYRNGQLPRNMTFPSEWVYGLFNSNGSLEILLDRWHDLKTPWGAASYVVAEFIMRGMVTYVEGPTFDFTEGSDSEKSYGAKSFGERLQQRLRYTLGCFRVRHKLPTASLLSQCLLLRMCWNDARRKTRYKLLWIF